MYKRQAELPTPRPRKKAKMTPPVAKKRLAWAKEVKEPFGNEWSKEINTNFALINQ